MKPFRGKRIGPQSRLAEFNSPLGGVAEGGILSDPSPFTAAVGGCTFRLVERHDRFAGGHKPPGKVARGSAVSVIAHGWRRPAGGPRNHYPPCRPSRLGRPAISRRSTGEDCLQCLPTAARHGVGSLPCRHSGSVAIRSAPYPTRLETRTKESNMCASHGVLRNLKAQ